MNERPEDDPGADTEMFRAYVEHGDGADSPSPGVPVGVLVGAAVVLMIVVVVLILLLI
jgi:hypothetical protein